MFLARVKGHIVATAKDPSLTGWKLAVVEPLKVDYPPIAAPRSTEAPAKGGDAGSAARFGETGRAIVALDSIGAGEGQVVLIAQGSSARMAEGCGKVPVDAVVIGIVDQTMVDGKPVT